ncbi:selenoneine synthase SenA [Piscinibacter sp.]|uniref:selenoneine synthase SenA n=1 Tax=Piscinibacter sp. TaxID=1903157 RepID=UPI002C3B5D9B|nr:selenoneine synthase SenA [Albitalea sp.]HUG22475.1 selenoneine synthase SenA [Albitalea sp.]
MGESWHGESGSASDPRRLSGSALAAALRDSRAVTLARVGDLDDAQWHVPQRPGLNPIAWELAHLAWFGEFWVLRGPHQAGADGFVHAARPARIAGPDAHLDSARLPHEQRWTTAMPSRRELMQMLAAQLDACLRALPDVDDDAALYFHRLALLHEDMHGEAFAWLRATLGHPAPAGVVLRPQASHAPLTVRGGSVHVGWPPGRRGFAFDNERPSRPLVLDDFEIDAAPLTAGEFLRFVEAGGYDDPAFWPGAAGAWRAGIDRRHPERWRRGEAGWEQRWFDRWLPLDPHQPVIHVNAWEAQAYCRFAGRRLPRAAEWEHAATRGGSAPRFQWGRSVWEWTGDAFAPYPGFEPGPYKDYSAPWFGDHRELRGGSFVTHARMHDPRYRNFFVPARTDVFAGFRTAALRP